MPSSSRKNRKRNKGKERKAKKEEAVRVDIYTKWHSWATGKTPEKDVVIVHCNHGLAAVPDISHPFLVSCILFSIHQARWRIQYNNIRKCGMMNTIENWHGIYCAVLGRIGCYITTIMRRK